MKATLHPDTLPFLRELAQNNNREWFMANKYRWEAIRKEFESFVVAVLDAMLPLDPSLQGCNPKRCIYRIYRDTRFSADKSPYKNHISFFLPTGGNKKMAVPGYYLQIGEADYGLAPGCALGGGIFMPDPQALAAIRQEIFYNTTEFHKIIDNATYRKFYGTEFFTSHKLTRVPKGFPPDWQEGDLLKYKDYCTMTQIEEKYINTDKFFDMVIEAFSASVPLNKFIQQAMYEILGGGE